MIYKLSPNFLYSNEECIFVIVCDFTGGSWNEEEKCNWKKVGFEMENNRTKKNLERWMEKESEREREKYWIRQTEKETKNDRKTNARTLGKCSLAKIGSRL